MDSTRLFPSAGQPSGQYGWWCCGKILNIDINLHQPQASTSTLTMYVHLRRVKQLITLQSTSPNTQFTDHSGNESIVCEVRATKCSGFSLPFGKRWCKHCQELRYYYLLQVSTSTYIRVSRMSEILTAVSSTITTFTALQRTFNRMAITLKVHHGARPRVHGMARWPRR